jgi:hypothetical protein
MPRWIGVGAGYFRPPVDANQGEDPGFELKSVGG